MIIAVQGTHYGNNEAVKVLNALAVMGVATDQLTTMILQFTNKTRKSSEQYLIGKTLRNESLVQDASVPDISSGMDALCAHVLGHDDNAKFFSEVSRSLVLQKDRNLFDIVSVSRKESFEKEVLNKQRKPTIKNEEFAPELQDKDYLEHLLEAIDDVYKVVYVLMPSKNQALCQEILKYTDINIICVHQGNVEPVTHGGKRELYVATDYCQGSAYSSKVLAQMYGQKIMYGCMHNIQYNDACANGTALDYLKENLNAGPTNAAYNFIHNIEILYNALMRKTGRKTSEANPDELLLKYDGPKIMQVEWAPVTETVVRQIITTGTFKKQTTTNVMLEADPASNYKAPSEVEMMPANEAFGNDPMEEPEGLMEFGEFDTEDSIAAPAVDTKVKEEIPAPIDIPEPNFDDFDIGNDADESASKLEDMIATTEPEEEVQPEKPKKKGGFFGSLFGKKEKAPVAKHRDGELPPAIDEVPVVEDVAENNEGLLETPAENIEDVSKTPAENEVPEVSNTEDTSNDTGDIVLPDIADFDAGSDPTPEPEPVVIIPEPEPEPRVITPEVEPEEAPVKKTRKPRAKKAKVSEEPVATSDEKQDEEIAANTENKSDDAAEAVEKTKPTAAKKPRKNTRKKTNDADTASDTDDDWVIG